MTPSGSTSAYGAVVWDFDGTLVRRPDMWCAAIAEAIRQCGGPKDTAAADFEETAYLHLPWHGAELRHRFDTADAWWDGFLTGVAPLVTEAVGDTPFDLPRFRTIVRSIILAPDRYQRIVESERLVDELHNRGVPQFVLSNHVPELGSIVATIHPHRFQKVWTSGLLGFEKPRTEAFRFALEEIGRRPQEVLMIGDDVIRDLEPARLVGMQAVQVRDLIVSPWLTGI